jgi:hypothetical protein
LIRAHESTFKNNHTTIIAAVKYIPISKMMKKRTDKMKVAAAKNTTRMSKALSQRFFIV